MRLGIAGPQLDRPPQVQQGLLRALQVDQQVGEVLAQLEMIGGESECRRVGRLGLGVAAGLTQGRPLVDPGLGVARLEPGDGGELLGRGRGVAGLLQQHAQLHPGAGEPRRQLDGTG